MQWSFFFSSRRRHTRYIGDWSSDVCSSDLGRARANITAWLAEAARGGLDAIVVTTSGCGTVIKDYGFMLREDRERSEERRVGKESTYQTDARDAEVS